MRDKLLQIRVDDDFLSKLEYLRRINGFKSIAETVRKIVEKEFKKEHTDWIQVTERHPQSSGEYYVTFKEYCLPIDWLKMIDDDKYDEDENYRAEVEQKRIQLMTERIQTGTAEYSIGEAFIPWVNGRWRIVHRFRKGASKHIDHIEILSWMPIPQADPKAMFEEIKTK